MSDDRTVSGCQADVHDLGYMMDQLTRFLSDNHVMFAKNLKMAISEGSERGATCQMLEFKAELISAQTSTPSSSTPLDLMDQSLISLDWNQFIPEASTDFGQHAMDSCPSGAMSFQDGHQLVHSDPVMGWFEGDRDIGASSSPASAVLQSLHGADEQWAPCLDITSVSAAPSSHVAAPAHDSPRLHPQLSGSARVPGRELSSLMSFEGGSSVQESTGLPASEADSTASIASQRLQTQLKSTARSILRADWAAYLRVELPRWARGDLWKRTTGAEDYLAASEQSRYRGLQVAYSTVCLLHTRLEDDAIRGRIALVELHGQYLQAIQTWKSDKSNRSIGRGHATCIIDYILKTTHRNWSGLDSSARKALRTQFHDRKRYGKRWATLADGLGKGIYLLCSHKLEKLVCNTAVKHGMLSWLIREAQQHDGGQQMRLLAAVGPMAEKVYSGQVCSIGEVDEILERVNE